LTNKKAISRAILSLGIFSLWPTWLAIVTYKPVAMKLFGPSPNNFSASGSFGDSFGALASFMATLAAVGAYLTFSSERDSRKKLEFESNFFTLLSNLESITTQLEVDFSRKDKESKFKREYQPLQEAGQRRVIRTFKGRKALAIILYTLRDKIKPDGFNDIKVVGRAYNDIFDRYVNGIGHYFRTVYNIFRLIEERCPSDEKYYARIVRSQLSNTELCLIAYNCIVGEGRIKFRHLAAKHALFHNLHRGNLEPYAKSELLFFIRKLPDSAFRFDDIPDITYDD